ncbi:uncharacterized protein LOC111693096 [Anoplophora glabripennis]|uniref:uncharacterized protein LOC111693096 n=1 Tax=Anoplophora glabripennis TaxID=217634 RepID=UPI000C769A17|nr:uncharacterized protein LOC111693096 [Anoplophora glabripennis]
MKWFTKRDVLTINDNLFKSASDDSAVTKRLILSMSQKVFNPIGVTAPTTLVPKLLLQKLWEKQIPWDTPVDDEVAIAFRNWLTGLPHLLEVEIPRWISTDSKDVQNLSIHVFCDASQKAYATVVYCRVEKDKNVSIHLLAAKSRVAPLRKLTIPRLELMGATIAARLYKQVADNLTSNFDCFFWCDSSTVITWIQSQEEWGTFVWNRVNEIRRLTPAEQWCHVPGAYNPADLPSRGCSPNQLLESKWWEGPSWLYQDRADWPSERPIVNEEEIAGERRKKLVTVLVNTEHSDFWHLSYFSSFTKTVRLIGWVFRYLNNVRYPAKIQRGDLSVNELDAAENFIFKLVQTESFTNINDKRISGLCPIYDQTGIIRLKSRVFNREDTDNYRFPIILSARHLWLTI